MATWKAEGYFEEQACNRPNIEYEALMETVKAYEEVIDFIATETKRDALLGFHPSEQARERVWDLISRDKNTGLSVEEKSELDHYMHLEHLMRMAKARVRRHDAGA